MSTKSPANHEKINNISWQKKYPVTPVTPVGLGTFQLLNQTGAVENSTVLTFQIPTSLGTVKLGGCWEIRYFSEFPFIEGLKFPCGFWREVFFSLGWLWLTWLVGYRLAGWWEWNEYNWKNLKGLSLRKSWKPYDCNCILWWAMELTIHPNFAPRGAYTASKRIPSHKTMALQTS